MSDHKIENDEYEATTPFENSYQLWVLVGIWAFFPSVTHLAAFAGGNGWWFCLFIATALFIIVLSERFKHLFKGAKWFRVLIYMNLSLQGALVFLELIVPTRDFLTFGPALAAILLFGNYFNIDTYITTNKIDEDVSGGY